MDLAEVDHHGSEQGSEEVEWRIYLQWHEKKESAGCGAEMFCFQAGSLDSAAVLFAWGKD